MESEYRLHWLQPGPLVADQETDQKPSSARALRAGVITMQNPFDMYSIQVRERQYLFAASHGILSAAQLCAVHTPRCRQSHTGHKNIVNIATLRRCSCAMPS